MIHENAESQAQPARAEQDGGSLCTGDTAGEGRARGIGSNFRGFGVRVNRAIGSQAIPINTFSQAIVGKIVSRLIDRAERQLKEAEECLVWYERQRQDFQAELSELKDILSDLQEESGTELEDQ